MCRGRVLCVERVKKKIKKLEQLEHHTKLCGMTKSDKFL